jgi:4a-hydroxytetrahydrobiopterin dehydratase
MSQTADAELSKMKCVACTGQTPTVTDAEIAKLKVQVPGWLVVKGDDGAMRLQRVFKFQDFAQALVFTEKIGQIAEVEQHHPAILTEYGKVTVTWWTHAIKGLSQNDFIMAAKTDRFS